MGYGGENVFPPPQSHNRENWYTSKSLRFIGLDVHKDSIMIAVAEAGREPAYTHGVQATPAKRNSAPIGLLRTTCVVSVS